MMEIAKSVADRFFLGFGSRPAGLPQWRISTWSFIGAFACITVLELLFTRTPAFENADVPMIIGSFVSHTPTPRFGQPNPTQPNPTCIINLDCWMLTDAL
jgi:hypothetical protein